METQGTENKLIALKLQAASKTDTHYPIRIHKSNHKTRDDEQQPEKPSDTSHNLV